MLFQCILSISQGLRTWNHCWHPFNRVRQSIRISYLSEDFTHGSMEFVSTMYRLFTSNPLGSLPCLLHLNLMKSQLNWKLVLRPSTSSGFRRIPNQRDLWRLRLSFVLLNGSCTTVWCNCSSTIFWRSTSHHRKSERKGVKKDCGFGSTSCCIPDARYQLRTGCSHRPPTSHLEVCYNPCVNGSQRENQKQFATQGEPVRPFKKK